MWSSAAGIHQGPAVCSEMLSCSEPVSLSSRTSHYNEAFGTTLLLLTGYLTAVRLGSSGGMEGTSCDAPSTFMMGT